MSVRSEIALPSFDREPYSITPVLSGEVTSLEWQLASPVRAVETLENSPLIWREIEVGLQFYYTYGRHPKLTVENPADFINLTRRYAAGYKQADLAREYQAGRTMVRKSADVLERVMAWVLDDETKSQIGLQNTQLFKTDHYVVEAYQTYRPLATRLQESDEMSTLAKSYPPFFDLLRLLSSGKNVTDLVGMYGVKPFFSDEDCVHGSEALRDFFIHQNTSENLVTVPAYQFLRRLLLAQFVAVETAEAQRKQTKTEQDLLEGLLLVSDLPGNRQLGQMLYATQRFLANSPYIDKQMATFLGNSFSPSNDLPDDVDVATFLKAHVSQEILPVVFHYVLSQAATKIEPQAIARGILSMGVAYSPITLTNWISEFLHVVENILLVSKRTLTAKKAPVVRKELSRRRSQEIARVLHFLRTPAASEVSYDSLFPPVASESTALQTPVEYM